MPLLLYLLCHLLLQDMLSDANPMVVANALAALQEIQEISGKEVLQITSHMLFKLLAALNECTEWGQVRHSLAVVGIAAEGAAASWLLVYVGVKAAAVP
jgi:vesicle coat complex subunit